MKFYMAKFHRRMTGCFVEKSYFGLLKRPTFYRRLTHFLSSALNIIIRSAGKSGESKKDSAGHFVFQTVALYATSVNVDSLLI